MTIRIPLGKTQGIALLLYVAVCVIELIVDGRSGLLAAATVLAIPLVPILFQGWSAFLARVGLPEFFASDHRSPPPDVAFSFVYWTLFVVFTIFLLVK